jgi:hypothetical protein
VPDLLAARFDHLANREWPMTQHSYEKSAVLLYGIVKGVPDDVIKDIFGRRRIRVDLEDERPEWVGQLSGRVVEIQTLYGEYGGYLGFTTYQSEAKLSPKGTLEREANIEKMIAIIQELTSRGELTLMLRTTEFVPGRLPRQVVAMKDVNEEILLNLPHNTVVRFGAIPRSARPQP